MTMQANYVGFLDYNSNQHRMSWCPSSGVHASSSPLQQMAGAGGVAEELCDNIVLPELW